MALTAEQRKNLNTILKVGKRMGASKKALKAAVEAGLVESNLRNLDYGDRDSVGVFQQRPSQGWKGLRNVERAAEEFFAQAIPNSKKYGTAGQLAQAVQRSAFPERYDQRSADAARLLRGVTGGTPTRDISGPEIGGGGDDQRKMIALSLLGLGGGESGSDDLLSLALAAKQADTQSVGQTPGRPSGGRTGGQLGANGRSIVGIGKLAQSYGLRVSEHPAFDKVDAVHAKGSYHYSNRAVDVSGDPAQMAKFARVVARRYGKGLAELIWRGKGAQTIDNGRRVPTSTFSGHTDHVHVAK